MASPLPARLEGLLRELAPQVLGAVVRRFHDFGASEDAVQEAASAPERDYLLTKAARLATQRA